MRLLTSTSDIVRIVTGSAVSTIGVHADWMDLLGLAVTPGRTNTLITTATTTTVVAAPAASTQRNVRGLTISNNHASSSCNITVQHFDGTNSVDDFPVTALLAGERGMQWHEQPRQPGSCDACISSWRSHAPAVWAAGSPVICQLALAVGGQP